MVIDDVLGFCERAYDLYHHPRYIIPDPLQIVLEAPARDREVIAFIATALALGRVQGILAAIREVLSRLRELNRSVTEGLLCATAREVRGVCRGFVYRFFDQDQLAAFLASLGRALRDHGSLERLFEAHAGPGDGLEPEQRTIRGLEGMVRALRERADGELNSSILLPLPERGSACKRLLLFLRWMVRSDEIDPGGWSVLDPAELLVPVDTHMQSVARAFGVASSRHPSLKSSRTLTALFREFAPEDPARYDFCLTRLGIHPELDKQAFVV